MTSYWDSLKDVYVSDIWVSLVQQIIWKPSTTHLYLTNVEADLKDGRIEQSQYLQGPILYGSVLQTSGISMQRIRETDI